MPDTDPITSDDDAKQLFAFESEVKRTLGAWESLKEQAKEAKDDYEEARARLESAVSGHRQRYPLFDQEDTGDEDDETPVRLATNPQSATNRRA